MVCLDFIQTGEQIARRCAAGQTALPLHNFQMASHFPPNVALPYTDVIETATVFKRPLGVSLLPATESQPYKQMWHKRYRAAGKWRRVDGKQRWQLKQASMSEEQLRSLGQGARTDGEAEDAVYGWVRAQTGSE